jgi:hypothetical protein
MQNAAEPYGSGSLLVFDTSAWNRSGRRASMPSDRASRAYRFFLPRARCFPRFFLCEAFLAFGQPVTEIFVL